MGLSNDGVLSFPQLGEDFTKGNLFHALGAKNFQIQFFQERLNLDEATSLYCSISAKKELGELETKPKCRILRESGGELNHGAFYEGEWKKTTKILQGKGSLTRTNGTKYFGWFKDSLFHGKGKFTFPEGDELNRKMYIGSFKDGMFEGFGTMYFHDGGSLLTKWTKGQQKGQGSYTFQDGSKVRFVLEEGKPVFERRIVFPMKDYKLEYRGFVKADHIMHGHGILVLKNNEKFEGHWRDGESLKYRREFSGIEAGLKTGRI